MTSPERSIHCSDCGTTFTFSAGERELYASKGFTNDPKRCPTCRAARRVQRERDGGHTYVHNPSLN